MTEKPPLVMHDETPERLVLSWRAPVLVRVIGVVIGIGILASAPFVVPLARTPFQAVFFAAIFALMGGAGIAVWFDRARVELSAAGVRSTRRFAITYTQFARACADINVFEVKDGVVWNGPNASEQIRIRAIMQTNGKHEVVAEAPSIEIANYVCKQLTRRLVELRNVAPATPYR